jgi:hypothetical protein
MLWLLLLQDEAFIGLNLADDGRVIGVAKASPAQAAGFRPGDRVVSIDLARHKPGDEIQVPIERDGQALVLKAVLSKPPRPPFGPDDEEENDEPPRRAPEPFALPEGLSQKIECRELAGAGWKDLTYGGHQPLAPAFYTRASFVDGAISASIQIDEGDGGLVLRAESPEDYYVVRLSVAEDNVRFYRVQRGIRRGLAKADVALRAGTAYALRIEAMGPEFRIVLDGRELFRLRDAVFQCGLAGAWSMGDSRVQVREFILDPK